MWPYFVKKCDKIDIDLIIFAQDFPNVAYTRVPNWKACANIIMGHNHNGIRKNNYQQIVVGIGR